jgi:cytochrome c oxidase subunit IV
MSDDKPEAEKAEADQAELDKAEKAEAAAKNEAIKAATSTSQSSSEADHTVHTTETTATTEERTTLDLSAEPKRDEPKKNGGTAHGVPAHDDAHAQGAAHAHDHGHGLAHTMPIPLLFGVLAALLVLTIATVAVTSIDLGAQGNLIVAMVIATIKAALVCTFFMHLLWDKKFNLVLFLTSVLFLILFLSMTTADRGENQQAIDEYRATQLGVK